MCIDVCVCVIRDTLSVDINVFHPIEGFISISISVRIRELKGEGVHSIVG